MNLVDAQSSRHERAVALEDQRLDQLLDAIGLSESDLLGTADVSPADRQKLKGIIARLRRSPKPFSQCMSDLRKHQPGWSEERRKKTCNVLRELTGRKNGGNQKINASQGEGACVLLDVATTRLLDMVDLDALARETESAGGA